MKLFYTHSRKKAGEIAELLGRICHDVEVYVHGCSWYKVVMKREPKHWSSHITHIEIGRKAMENKDFFCETNSMKDALLIGNLSFIKYKTVAINEECGVYYINVGERIHTDKER